MKNQKITKTIIEEEITTAFIGRVGVNLQLSKIGAKILERMQIETPFGNSAPIYLISWEDTKFVALSRHGEEGYRISAPFVNSRANIWALKEIGIQRIISFSSPGSLSPDIPASSIVIPHDVIDETKRRPITFFEGKGLGFIRQNPLFCPDIRQALSDVIKAKRLTFTDKGVYVCTEGPRIETASEIKKYRLFGGDLIGETLVPEIFLARELEMCYGALCLVSNLAEGIVKRPFEPHKLFQGLVSDEEEEKISQKENLLPEIALKTVLHLKKVQKTCLCHRTMEFYKRRGDIGEDFRKWILPQQ